jgi:AraC-like DNA-binding protein
LLSHLATHYGDSPPLSPHIRGGLAPWQERRAKEMLLANIDGRIGLNELVRACGLTRSHFARAFKVGTGVPPLQWLLNQRIDTRRICCSTRR